MAVVIDQWSRHRNTAIAPLDVESASKGQTIRIETTITDWWSEPEFWEEAEFWEEVGHMADTVELADRCGQPP